MKVDDRKKRDRPPVKLKRFAIAAEAPAPPVSR